MHGPELLRGQDGRARKGKGCRQARACPDHTGYKQQPEDEKTIPRNKYVEIREERPDTPEKAKWAEFKTCKYTTEAIVSDGIGEDRIPAAIWPKCGSTIHIIDPLSVSVVAERLLYRSQSDLDAGDYTFSIVSSAIAVEAAYTRLSRSSLAKATAVTDSDTKLSL
jgi:hypothetical protein